LRFTELSDFGDVEGAARVARDALGLARKLPAISIHERDLILSDALERLGIALSNRSPGGEGESLLVEAVERIEAAAAASPDPAGLEPSLHRLLFNLALARLTGGKRDEALAGFEKVDAWLRNPLNKGDDGGSMAGLRVLTKQKLVELRHPGATE
jgi:tetratricopeptide (TPR) repeat protein